MEKMVDFGFHVTEFRTKMIAEVNILHFYIFQRRNGNELMPKLMEDLLYLYSLNSFVTNKRRKVLTCNTLF